MKDNARVVKSVDTTDLKSVGESHDGSTPSSGTTCLFCHILKQEIKRLRRELDAHIRADPDLIPDYGDDK